MYARETIERVWTLVQPPVLAAIHWIAAARVHIAVFLVVFVLGLFGFLLYRDWNDKEIVLYVGPAGSSGQNMSTSIVSQLENTVRTPGVNYRVRVEPTQGYDAIEDRIHADRTGHAIGFALDSIFEKKGINVLLPLDYDYLHILCRKEFLEKHLTAEKKYPTQLSEIVALLPDYGCVFAGPPESGSRRLADLVLGHYGRDVDRMSNPALNDWIEARAAMQQGTIDVAFFIGPYGAGTINKIASDRTAVLLGIDEVQEALARQEEYALMPVTFPRHAYTARRYGTSDEAEADFHFCREQLGTLAARRLMVCSEKMSKDDAYLIAGAVREALADQGPMIGNWDATPADEATIPAASTARLGLKAHPGAALFRERTPPWTWWRPWTWSPLAASSLAAVMALMLQEITSAVVRRRSTTTQTSLAALPAPATPPPGANGNVVALPAPPPMETVIPSYSELYLRTQREIEQDIDDLWQQANKLTRREWSLKREEVVVHGEQLRKQYADGAINPKEAAILAHALHDYVQLLEFFKPRKGDRQKVK